MLNKPKKFESAISESPEEAGEKNAVKKEVTAEELAERLERISSMGKIIGEDFDMKIVVGKKPGWRYKFRPVNTIEVDGDDIKEKGVDYCLGIIAHEGAHRRVSRVDFIPKSVWQKTGFSFLMNAVEDPRVNNWVSDKYEGASDWLKTAYDRDLSPEAAIVAQSKNKLGYTPKHIKYGLEIIRHWHTGRFSEDVQEDVLTVLKKTVKSAETAYGTLPDKEPAERDIEEKAKSMYEIVYSKIWPEYQKLVEESLDEETMRQMLKDMIERGEIDLSPEGRAGEKEDGEPLLIDELPDDLKKQLEKKIKEKLEGMSEEDREKLLGDMEKKAGEALDGLESDLNKELRGHFSEQPKTKGEDRERESEKKEANDRAKEIAGARREIERQMEAEKSEYDRAYESVKQYIDKVAEDIMNVLIAKRFPQFRRGFPGQKLRLKGAMKYESQKEYRDLFERRLSSERQEYSFLLLVDLSGSMAGEKIQETFKGAVLFAEALGKISQVLGSVKVAIYGFQDTLIPYKNFDDPVDNNLREKMSEMPQETTNSGRHNGANWNSDGYCVDAASAILNKEMAKNKFLVVLSDGQPASDDIHRVPRYSGFDANEELRKVVGDISRAGEQRLLGIGLGPGTEHVADFYNNKLDNIENMPSIDVRKLVETLGKKLEELIK